MNDFIQALFAMSAIADCDDTQISLGPGPRFAARRAMRHHPATELFTI
jgi:hypothetical protein